MNGEVHREPNHPFVMKRSCGHTDDLWLDLVPARYLRIKDGCYQGRSDLARETIAHYSQGQVAPMFPPSPQTLSQSGAWLVIGLGIVVVIEILEVSVKGGEAL